MVDEPSARDSSGQCSECYEESLEVSSRSSARDVDAKRKSGIRARVAKARAKKRAQIEAADTCQRGWTKRKRQARLRNDYYYSVEEENRALRGKVALMAEFAEIDLIRRRNRAVGQHL